MRFEAVVMRKNMYVFLGFVVLFNNDSDNENFFLINELIKRK